MQLPPPPLLSPPAGAPLSMAAAWVAPEPVLDPDLLNELLSLSEHHGHDFINVNLPDCWSRLESVTAERGWLQANDGAQLVALREETKLQAWTFDAPSVSNTAHALATLAIPGAAWGSLWKKLERAALAHIHDLNPQDLVNTAWAFTTAGRATPALFDAIAAMAERYVHDFSPKELANVAWAFAAADCLPSASSFFDEHFALRCEALAHEFEIEELSQLHQWQLWYAGERGCYDALPGEGLLVRCAAAFRVPAAAVSQLQSQVAETLASMQLSVVQEVLLDEGYSLDMVVVDGGFGNLIAVEVDGPPHFVGREPTCATLLKRRQLKHLGWRLESVAYWEWNALNHRDESTRRRQRAEYLGSLLDIPPGEIVHASATPDVGASATADSRLANSADYAAAGSANVPSRRDSSRGRSEDGGEDGERHARFERERRSLSARGDRDESAWARASDGPDGWRMRNPSRSRSRSRERYPPGQRRGGGEWFGEGAPPQELRAPREARDELAPRYGREPVDSRRGRDDRDAQLRGGHRRHSDPDGPHSPPPGWRPPPQHTGPAGRHAEPRLGKADNGRMDRDLAPPQSDGSRWKQVVGLGRKRSGGGGSQGKGGGSA